jgi:hypothetical protein
MQELDVIEGRTLLFYGSNSKRGANNRLTIFEENLQSVLENRLGLAYVKKEKNQISPAALVEGKGIFLF